MEGSSSFNKTSSEIPVYGLFIGPDDVYGRFVYICYFVPAVNGLGGFSVAVKGLLMEEVDLIVAKNFYYYEEVY